MDSFRFLDPKKRFHALCHTSHGLKNSATVLEDNLWTEELVQPCVWGYETREDCGHFICFVNVQFVLNKSQN